MVHPRPNATAPVRVRRTSAAAHPPRLPTPCLSPQIAFIVLASTIPIGMPVVVGAVLAVGAREMVAEKAIVSR